MSNEETTKKIVISPWLEKVRSFKAKHVSRQNDTITLDVSVILLSSYVDRLPHVQKVILSHKAPLHIHVLSVIAKRYHSDRDSECERGFTIKWDCPGLECA